MSKNSKELKEELFERTGALHRKLIPASDSIREGYILMGRRDLIPQIRKLVLRATALVFMKYKKDVIVKELPLIEVQSVAQHNRNRACFALKVRTKRKIKTLVLETRNSVDSSSWVEAIKNALIKLHASSTATSSANAPKNSALNRSRRHSDPPTPTFTKEPEPSGGKRVNDSKDAASDDDDEEETSESESDDSDFGDPRAGSNKASVNVGNQGVTGIPHAKLPVGAFDGQKPPLPGQQPLPGWPLPGQQQQQQQEIAFNPFAVNVAAGQPGVPFGFGAPVQTSQFVSPQQLFMTQQLLQQQQQQQQQFQQAQQQQQQFQQAQQQHTQQMQQLQQQQQQQQQQARQPYVMCSSLTVVPEGTKVVKEHGFVSATVTEQIGQLLQNNPGDLDSKVDQLREQTQKKLIGQVVDKGGNAVLGITFNMSFQPSGAFVLCAFGTACSLA